MNNIQAYKRCSVDGEGIITTESGEVRLRLIEISAAGALAAVPRRLSDNPRYNIQLIFQIRLVHIQFRTEARIIRLLEESADQYVYEFKFVNLNDKIRVEIDEIINREYFPEYDGEHFTSRLFP